MGNPKQTANPSAHLELPFSDSRQAGGPGGMGSQLGCVGGPLHRSETKPSRGLFARQSSFDVEPEVATGFAGRYHPRMTRERSDADGLAQLDRDELAETSDEPPVVARMVVEIRSNGLRTIARGAMEDAQTGQKVAVVAEGTTPIALATSLAKSMFSAPMMAGHAVKALLRAKLGRKRE
jgi:hypothetical protein